MPYSKCIHDMSDPNHSIVFDPKTFLPYCAVCKQPMGIYNGSITVPAVGSLGGQVTIQIHTGKSFPYPDTMKKEDPEKEKTDAFDRAMRGIG